MTPVISIHMPDRLVAFLLSVLTMCCLSLLAGCNGGGTETTPASIAPNAEAPALITNSMTGVAAIGRPLDGYVYIQDTAGIMINVPVGTDGSYQADVGGMLPPFIVRVQASDGGVWYSYAPSRVPANVSQLTTLVMFIASGKADLAALFDNWPQQHASLTATAMLHAQAVVNLNFSTSFAQHGLDHTIYNFFTTSFEANGTGFDAVLDDVGHISFGPGVYAFTNPVHQAAFDENLPVTDQGMLDSLGSSVIFTWTQPPGMGPGIITDSDGSMIYQPPSMSWVMICDDSGETCPEGASCIVVECNLSESPDGGYSSGYISTSATRTSTVNP